MREYQNNEYHFRYTENQFKTITEIISLYIHEKYISKPEYRVPIKKQLNKCIINSDAIVNDLLSNIFTNKINPKGSLDYIVVKEPNKKREENTLIDEEVQKYF